MQHQYSYCVRSEGEHWRWELYRDGALLVHGIEATCAAARVQAICAGVRQVDEAEATSQSSV
jgi:hypothetical protein